MQHCATESGKSKGQFYTPAEVSRIMARVVGIGPDTRSDHTISSTATGIPACILVIDKAAAGARRGVFMIDASRGFLKDGNKNRLRAQDIHRIVDVFNRQIELPRYSRMVPVAEIAGPANEYNLNIPRYVDSIEPEDLLARFADLALLDRWGSQRLLSHQPAQVPPLLLGLSRDSTDTVR